MKPVPFDDLPDELQAGMRVVPIDDLPDHLRPKEEERGYFSNMGSLLVDGGRRALTAARVSPSVIAGEAPTDHIDRITDQLQRPAEADPPELQEVKGAFEDDGQAWEDAEGFWQHASAVGGMLFEAGRQAVTNPKGLSYLTAEQAANMVPSIVGMLAGGKAGSMAGGVVGPIGAGVGAVGGATLGAFAGGAPIEVGSEFIALVGEELAERGLDPTEENVMQLLQDREFTQQAIADAKTKGAVTAGIDAALTVVSGGIATAPQRAALRSAAKELGPDADGAAIARRARQILGDRTLAQRVGTGGKAVGVDVAGGGISEAGGQLAAYGEVDLAEVGLEMLGELGGTAIEVPAAARAVTSHMRRQAPTHEPVQPLYPSVPESVFTPDEMQAHNQATQAQSAELARQQAAEAALRNARTADEAIAAATNMAGDLGEMTAAMDVDAEIARSAALRTLRQQGLEAQAAAAALDRARAEALPANVPQTIAPAQQEMSQAVDATSVTVPDQAAAPQQDALITSAQPGIQPQATFTPTPQSPTLKGRDVTPPGSAQDAPQISTVYTPEGRPVDVRYRVVDVADLVTYHTAAGAANPAYPASLQPRDRSRSASELQIHNIATNLQPELLGASANTTDGAPIVSPEGIVESGNGRTLALARAYEQDMPSAQAYRAWLQSQGYEVDGMRAPVLVRQRETPMSDADLQAYTRESNERTTAAMSETEQAQADAHSIAPILGDFAGGDLMAAANRDFVRKFLRDIASPSSRGDLVSADGTLSQRGQRRIQAAMMAAAYDSPEIVADLFESADSDIRAIGGALQDVAGQWAQLREAVRNGVIEPSMDITPQLVGAVNLVRRARAEGRSISDLAHQIDIVSGATDPITMDFLRLFFRGDAFTRARSRAAMAGALTEYVAIAQRVQPGENMFGEAPPTGADVLRTTHERTQREEGAGKQADLVASTQRDADSAGQPGQEGRGPGPSAVRERSARYTEPGQVGERDGQTIDMFSGQGQSQQGLDLSQDRARTTSSRRRAASRIPSLPEQTSPALGIITEPEEGGRFAVSVEAKQTGSVSVGVDLIKTHEDAAHALASLRKYPQENMVALVTDADGRPISILRHTIGQIAAAAVVPSLVAGHVARVPNAAHVWLAHNHPSGRSSFSEADIRVTDAYAGMTEGSSVSIEGMFAIAGSSYAFYEPRAGLRLEDQKIRPMARTRRIPVTERFFRRVGRLHPDSLQPDTAPSVADRLLGGEPGIVYLDSQFRPVAVMPMTVNRMAKLKGTGGVDQVFRGVERSNAIAAMVRVPSYNREAVSAARNVATLMSNASVNVVDILAGQMSLVGLAEPITRRDGHVEGRDPLLFGANTGVPVGQVEALVNRITTNLPGTSDVEIRVVRNRLHVDDAEGVLPSLGAEGIYFPASETDGQVRPARIYLMAQSLRSMERAEQVLAHELVGHFGMEAMLGERFSSVLEGVIRIARAPEGVDVGIQRVGDPYYATMDAVQRDYPDYSPANQAREVLARMAETNVRPHFLEMVYAHIRRFLRSLGIRAPLSAAEIKTMVVDSAKQLRRTPGGQALRGSLSAAESLRTAGNRSAGSATADGRIHVRPGKGQIKDKYLVYVDGDSAPGGPWDTPEAASEAGRQWLNKRNQQDGERAAARSRKNEIASRLAQGIPPTDVELQALGLRRGASDLRWFIPAASDLFGISARAVRPHLDGLIRTGHTDMGAKRETVEPIKALLQMAERLNPPGTLPLFSKRPKQAPQREGLSSSGRQQTDTPEFRRWFGDSQVVDENGEPMVVYHGTGADIDQFSRIAWGSVNPTLANEYAEMRGELGGGQANVMPVYMSISRPFDADLLETTTSFDYPDGLSVKRFIDQIIEQSEVGDRQQARLRELEREIRFASRREESGPSYSPQDFWHQARMMFGEDGAQAIQEAFEIAGFDGIKFTEQGAVTYGAFLPEQVKSATGNRGTFDAGSPDIMESRATNIFGQPVTPTWDAPADSKLADFIYLLQDKHVDTRDVVKAIEAKSRAIEDRWNPYLQEELYHGRAAKATEDFLKDELRPLLQEMLARNVKMEEFETYLHNLHAEERNEQVARVNPAMPDGGSGINTADAQAYLAGLDPNRRRAYEALAKRVQDITAGTRELLVRSGLEAPETIRAWENTYFNYVPLQREDMDFGQGMGTGQGYSIRGSSSRRAIGSSRGVVDILANIAMQRERAITRAEKNRVAVAVYGLATLEPNTDFWMAVNPQALKDVNQTVNELVQMGLNPLDAQNLISEPKQAYIDPRTGLVSYRVNPAMRNNANVMSVRVNGQERYVFFNERNPRGQRMVSAMKNLDADQLGRAMGYLAQVTRWFAAVNTQYNPIFGVVNFTRDTQAAMLQLSTTELRGKEKEVLTQLIPALRGIYSQIRADRKGGTTNSTWAALWDQFQRTGGKTGYRDQFLRSEERALALEKELKRISEGKARQAGRAIFDWLSDYNDTMENAVRLAAFKTGLDSGLSAERSASIAKNLTVNFNRKGQIATQASAMYAFFNAAVQGTTRMLETLRGPIGGKVISGGLLLGVMQALALSAAGYDEEEPPDFVRERSLIIPLGTTGKYVTIPYPLGFNVLPNTGRVLTEYAMSGWRDPTKRISQISAAFMDMFNPIGHAGWSAQTIAPTAVDPLVALSENRDWTGKPIAREDFSSLNPTPGYTRAKETASVIGEKIAYALNAISGGTDFKPGLVSPTPDQIDYLVGQVLGGVGREANKAIDTTKNLFTGEETPPYKIPLLGRFYGNTESSAAESNRFYNNVREINMHQNEIKGRREQGRDVMGYLRDNPEARLARQAKRVESDIRKMRERRRRMLDNKASRESIKLIEERITRRMKSFNDQVRRLQESHR